VQRFGLIAAIVAVICGISRLAKFNITKETKSFVGLPTPMFALVTVSLVFLNIKMKEEIALLLFFILSYLMVSHLKYPSFKEESMAKYKYAAIMLFIAIIVTLLLNVNLSYIAIGVNVYLWAFIGLPLMFSKQVKRKRKLTLFYLGMILATIAFYQEPKMLLVLPFIYTVIAGWLVQSALTIKEVN
jgi:phosphatidylserine synthase